MELDNYVGWTERIPGRIGRDVGSWLDMDEENYGTVVYDDIQMLCLESSERLCPEAGLSGWRWAYHEDFACWCEY